jgi:hypothetical protein
MAVWITIAARQNLDLVRADYYEEEIRYQRQLDRLNRTAALRSEVAIQYDAAKSEVTIQLPTEHIPSRPAGRIHFYRPSEAALDFEVPLAVNAQALQCIGGQRLRPGQWKVRVGWTAAGQEYFYEQTLVADSTPTASKAGRSLGAATADRD